MCSCGVTTVVTWFLEQLFAPWGLCPSYSPQQIMDGLDPSNQIFLQSKLWRQPLRPQRGPGNVDESQLVGKLGNLISVKGEDILLTTSSSQLTKFHRLRASVPSRLWRWKLVTGWAWTGQPGHINSLELRAVLTTLKGCICHRRQAGTPLWCCMQARGRFSSRKLRSGLSRVNALLLCSGCQPLWGYVHTDLNPADKPSQKVR